MTIYDVKRIHEQKDPDYFFTRDTMKFFHQTLKDFSVHKINENKYRISAPMKYNGKVVGFTVRIFDAETGTLELEEN